MMSPGVMRPLLAPIRSRLSALRRGTWMPTERLAMRHVRDVIRLKSAGMSTRAHARRLGAAPAAGPVSLRRFADAGPRRASCDGAPVVIDRRSGERRAAQIFVAVLGASSFTYAQATWTQGLADWISGHVGAFEATGGVPALLVPDNTKVAVIKACLYDPQINRSYADMAAHYGTAILPARPRRPRDKTSVSYCTLFWRLRGDGDEPGRAGVAPSTAFENGLLFGQRPQAPIQMVTTAFCDYPLTAPL